MTDEISFNQLFSSAPEVRRLGVVGSRKWPSRDFVFYTITQHLEKWPLIDTIVSGGQPKGVDGWAKEFAQEHNLALVEYLPAHWHPKDDPRYRPYKVYNYKARNTLIAGDVDALLAFCYNGSGGTTDTYTKALRTLEERAVLLTEKDLSHWRNQ